MLRRLARPMMAAVFIQGGIDTLRHPEPRVRKAENLPLPDAERLTRIDAGVKIGAGLLLALNRVPRLSSLALAASLVPTTFAGHRFWEQRDKAERKAQLGHFLKNMAIFGGLVIATVDRGGRRGGLPKRAREIVGRD